MKITVEDRRIDNETAYIWHAQDDKLLFRGITGSLLDALRAAGNAVQRSRGWPDQLALTLTMVEGENANATPDPDPII
jgi:hypothetical protein